MIYAIVFLFGIVFFEMFLALRITKDAMAIIARSNEAMRVLKSDLDDDEKEAFMRRGSADIFKATLRFALKFLSIGLALYLLFLLIVTLSPDARQPIADSLVSPVIIVMLTVAIILYAWARKALLARH